jgi:hypothetical protein
MNKRIARALRDRLAPLGAVAATFATITIVPAATTMIPAAGATAVHQARAPSVDLAPPSFFKRPPNGARRAAAAP